MNPCLGAKIWSFPIKTEVKWVLGIYIYMFIFGWIYDVSLLPAPLSSSWERIHQDTTLAPSANGAAPPQRRCCLSPRSRSNPKSLCMSQAKHTRGCENVSLLISFPPCHKPELTKKHHKKPFELSAPLLPTKHKHTGSSFKRIDKSRRPSLIDLSSPQPAWSVGCPLEIESGAWALARQRWKTKKNER